MLSIMVSVNNIRNEYPIEQRPIVLTIAGSDPSCGAGIQADLRVIHANGCLGLSAITALTIQNSMGVLAVHPVAADLLFDQLEALFDDTHIHAVKIGMLGGAEQVAAVALALQRFQPPNIVLDTVLASTGGTPLLDAAGRHRMLYELFPYCDLVTPNIHELSILTEIETTHSVGRNLAAQNLLEMGAKAVLVKGGHLEGNPTDTLHLTEGLPLEFVGERIETNHTHGTGCFLSSAIASNLALGHTIKNAVLRAKQFLTTGLRNPTILGKGRGYPGTEHSNHLEVKLESKHHAERQKRLWNTLYVLTDSEINPSRSHEEIAQAALAGGAKVIQLRDKRLRTPDLIATAKRIAQLCHDQDALFIVNDRVDVALAADADGVHLGPDDMSPADARKLMGADRLIGTSVSSVAEAEPFLPFISYFGVGAVFGSATKRDAGDPIGVKPLATLQSAFPTIPMVAIGGIQAHNIASVAATGVASAAVVSAVIAAPNMEEATRSLLEVFLDR